MKKLFVRSARQVIAALRVRLGKKTVYAILFTLGVVMLITTLIPAFGYSLNPTQPDAALVPTQLGPSIANELTTFNGQFIGDAAVFSSPSKESSSKKNAEMQFRDIGAAKVTHGERFQTARGKVNDYAATRTEARLSINKKGARLAPRALVEGTDQNVRDSTYEPENNIGSPPNQSEMDSPNLTAVGRIKHRAGIANYSFDVPFAALSGRGIDASIGMTYNSRVWNKTGESPNALFQFNVDQNWLTPGFTFGYGKLMSHFSSKIVLLTNNQYKTFNEVIPEGFIDPDGTRHQFQCKARSPIPNTQTFADNTYCTEYGTTDGTFIKVLYSGNRPLSAYLVDDLSAYASTYFTLVHTDGSKVTYSVPGAQFGATDYYREHYPILIQDRNGNQIQIAYKGGKDTIESIRDTLGRYIKFYYDPTAEKKLVAVTVPGFNGGAELQTVRFYYDENVSLNYQGKFSGSATAPAAIRELRYVYFPATASGYRYDYHSSFGMITKITKLTGMTVAGGTSLTSTGSVTSDGTTAATTEYLYANDGSQTPLTDVPKYNQRTDDWQGRTSTTAPITYYDAPEPGTGADRNSTTTVSDASFDIEYKTVTSNTTDWQNGLPKQTSVTRRYGPARQFTALMAKTVYFWIQGIADPSGRQVPVLNKVEITNDAGQTRAVSFAYDGYNNQTVVREHDFAAPGTLGTELRRTETTYETGAGWIGNQMFRLPKEIKTIANGIAVSKIVYEYDNYSVTPLADAPGVIQHNPDYNLNAGTHQCNCHYECDPGDFPPHCPFVCDECPNQDPSTLYRANITKVTSFSNAALTTDPDASVHTMTYDITGNVVAASMSCCNMKLLEYSAANQYAYVTKETKGSLPNQLVTQTAYDFNTGLVLSSTDVNSQQTAYTYDPTTLRQTRADFPNGAWATSEINDTQFPYFAKTTSCLDANRSVSSWRFINGAGQVFRSRRLTANGYISSDVEFDALGRATKSFSPYTVAGLSDPRPVGIKFSEVTQMDALGRVLETTLPDGTTIQRSFSGVMATITDQAGKKRRQIVDVLGRIVRVDEPSASGDLGDVGSPVQPTYYQYDGNNNLTRITQSEGAATQVREFQYDSLSRLRRERQVEAMPTLDINGVHGNADPAKWTGVYNYNTDGLLTDGTDARGVKTTITYDGLNRMQTVAYAGETGYQTPTVTYTYDESENGFYNNGRLTKVQTAANATYGVPETIQNYRYDKVGQVAKHTQSIGYQTYLLQYGYNLAGQLTTETYPSGKIVTNTIDNFGSISTIADQQGAYLSGIATNNQGRLSQINFGNGTNETYAYNDRFQMTNQSLQRGSEVLQKYEYSYGTADLSSGTIDTTKNNGQLSKIESYIGAGKQWSQRFGYDELGRLKESREYRGDDNSLTYKQVFDFDRFGNLYRKQASNPTTGQQNPLPYTSIEDADISKSTNKFTSGTGTVYDDAGAVITDTKFRGMGFGYDANGRMVKATKANTPDASTVYDGIGNRVATKINDVWQYMVYDAFGKLIAEYGNPDPPLPTKIKYIQQDWQGSVRSVINSNGYVIGRSDYTAFGEDINVGVGLRTQQQGYASPISQRQGYGLTERDGATGLDHTAFRKNENQAGRWTSPDPNRSSMNSGNPQSFNQYSYVGNEPIGRVDPAGLETCDIEFGWEQCGGGGFWGGNFGNDYAVNYEYRGIPVDIQEAENRYDTWSNNYLYPGQILDVPIYWETDSEGNIVTWFELFLSSYGLAPLTTQAPGDRISIPSMGSRDFDDRGSPGVITPTEMDRYDAERDARRKKNYDDCYKGETDRVLAGQDYQDLARGFVSTGLGEHGVGFGLGELGRGLNNRFNPKMDSGTPHQGSVVSFILGQIIPFNNDLNRMQAIGDFITPRFQAAREKCQKLYGS